MSNGNESRQKLTVIIPSFNEEARIEACLKSVAWADEILLVDSFSTDRTSKGKSIDPRKAVSANRNAR